MLTADYISVNMSVFYNVQREEKKQNKTTFMERKHRFE